MNRFFAHLPATREREKGIIASGVRDFFCVPDGANGQDWGRLQNWLNQHQGLPIIAVSAFESGFDWLQIKVKKKDLIQTPTLIWVIPEKFEILEKPQDLATIAAEDKFDFVETESKEQYQQNLLQLKHHLLRGDIYETNYCLQLQAKMDCLQPYHHWLHLYESHPAPHAAYFQWNQFHLMCLSPERFILKKDHRLLSQPIKGTIARPSNPEENQKAIDNLLNSNKERSENTMIVDLVRNDMSKMALPRSVNVSELCGIHSFSTLHHLISTVECSIASSTSIESIFKSMFPMGSMTGVPKKSAVSITHSLEQNARGWYSGTCGWIQPNGDFDFNVIIRSIIYDDQQKMGKIGIGSAITLQSNFQSEWEECWLKAKSLITQNRKHATA